MNPTSMYKCLNEGCGWTQYVRLLTVEEHKRIIRRSKCPECGQLVLLIDRIDFVDFDDPDDLPDTIS